jgi:hypothetical protein
LLLFSQRRAGVSIDALVLPQTFYISIVPGLAPG